MLSEKELRIIEQLVFFAENSVEECDHNVNICFCGVTTLVINGYEILHAYGKGEHVWVTDYDWDDAGNQIRLQRCDKCYVERSTTQAPSS